MNNLTTFKIKRKKNSMINLFSTNFSKNRYLKPRMVTELEEVNTGVREIEFES